MHSTIKLTFNIFFVLIFSLTSWAATLSSPKEDEQVFAGTWINVIVKPDPSEQWQGFVLGFTALDYDSVNKLYKTTIQVPIDVLGYRDDLRVIGVNKSGNEIELKRRVFVKLPPHVVLQSIEAEPSLIVLKVFSTGSDPKDIEIYGTRQLHIFGIYSDKVNRELTTSSSGTSYVSSDDKIATVSAEGKVTAQSAGRAKIIAQHNNFKTEVDIVIKPYKK
jgi:hypothetical protein